MVKEKVTNGELDLVSRIQVRRTGRWRVLEQRFLQSRIQRCRGLASGCCFWRRRAVLLWLRIHQYHREDEEHRDLKSHFASGARPSASKRSFRLRQRWSRAHSRGDLYHTHNRTRERRRESHSAEHTTPRLVRGKAWQLAHSSSADHVPCRTMYSRRRPGGRRPEQRTSIPEPETQDELSVHMRRTNRGLSLFRSFYKRSPRPEHLSSSLGGICH